MKIKIISVIAMVLIISLSVAGQSRYPAYQLKSIDGAVYSSKNLRGKAVFLTFFARTCKPCQEEVPLLNALQTQYKNTLAVIGVAFKENDPQKIRNLAEVWHIKYPVCPDPDGNVARAFDVHALPRGFLMDHRGALIKSYTGTTKNNESDLKKRLAESQNALKQYQATGPVFYVLPLKESNQEAAGHSKIWKSRIEGWLKDRNLRVSPNENEADYIISGNISMLRNITGIEIVIEHSSGQPESRFSDSVKDDNFTRLVGIFDETLSEIPFANRKR
jgi:peroxiredoxin